MPISLQIGIVLYHQIYWKTKILIDNHCKIEGFSVHLENSKDLLMIMQFDRGQCVKSDADGFTSSLQQRNLITDINEASNSK